MADVEAAKWNAKYSEFFVTRWSGKSLRQIQVGKIHTTIQAALAAAFAADKRHPEFMSFIDVIRPAA